MSGRELFNQAGDATRISTRDVEAGWYLTRDEVSSEREGVLPIAFGVTWNACYSNRAIPIYARPAAGHH
jgi:hypothetical protein